MAILPSKVCLGGCGKLIRGGGKCPECSTSEEQRRGSSHSRGYTGEWQRLRKMFLRRNPLCSDPFKLHSSIGRVEEASLVDHIIDHKGNKTLFWDVKNLQSLCPSCHVKKTFLQNPSDSLRRAG